MLEFALLRVSKPLGYAIAGLALIAKAVALAALLAAAPLVTVAVLEGFRMTAWGVGVVTASLVVAAGAVALKEWRNVRARDRARRRREGLAALLLEDDPATFGALTPEEAGELLLAAFVSPPVGGREPIHRVQGVTRRVRPAFEEDELLGTSGVRIPAWWYFWPEGYDVETADVTRAIFLPGNMPPELVGLGATELAAMGVQQIPGEAAIRALIRARAADLGRPLSREEQRAFARAYVARWASDHA